ncbi:uncharacterized protein [Argopecten irradians]
MSYTAQPTDVSISHTITVPSGNSQQQTEYPGAGVALGFPNQSPMEVDGGPVDQKCIDWQFYLDTLAPHISKELDDLATNLEIRSGKLESIRKEHATEHEICFHLLWAWRENCHKSGANDDARLRALHNALREAGLTILAEEPMKTRPMYTFTGKVWNGSTNLKDGIETLKVAKGIGNVHARFGRYFKLKEEEITRVFLNKNSDSSKQAKEIISRCIQGGLLRTRQELCNGLNYVENTRLIEDMNEYWSK